LTILNLPDANLIIIQDWLDFFKTHSQDFQKLSALSSNFAPMQLKKYQMQRKECCKKQIKKLIFELEKLGF